MEDNDQNDSKSEVELSWVDLSELTGNCVYPKQI